MNSTSIPAVIGPYPTCHNCSDLCYRSFDRQVMTILHPPRYTAAYKCLPCNTMCLTCDSDANTSYCLSCSSGYYPSSGSCFPCDSIYGNQCIDCDSSNCINCTVNYGLDTSRATANQCFPCNTFDIRC
jgi:hypothetical protein